MYRLDNRFAQRPFSVAVVGCGGTGGFVAEGLCRLLPPGATLALVDYDRVEERNLGRQSFLRQELGRFKAEALAERLARRYGRPVAYSLSPISARGFRVFPELVVGCVDNGLARAGIAGLFPSPFRNPDWWVDAGNGDSYGQVLIGNAGVKNLAGAFDPEKGICGALPLPTLQRPELLVQRPPEPSCAGAVEAGEQGPVINQAMAALVVEAVRRLIAGACPWMQLYLDLEAGTLHPVLAAPEAVARLTGLREGRLVRR